MQKLHTSYVVKIYFIQLFLSIVFAFLPDDSLHTGIEAWGLNRDQHHNGTIHARRISFKFFSIGVIFSKTRQVRIPLPKGAFLLWIPPSYYIYKTRKDQWPIGNSFFTLQANSRIKSEHKDTRFEIPGDASATWTTLPNSFQIFL